MATGNNDVDWSQFTPITDTAAPAAVDWSKFTPIDAAPADAVDWSQFTPVEDAPSVSASGVVKGLRAVNRAVNPFASIVESTEIGRDLNSLVGGGFPSGTGSAIEGIERLNDESKRPSASGIGLRAAMSAVNPLGNIINMVRGEPAPTAPFQPSAVARGLRGVGKEIQADVSPTMRDAMAGSELDGDLLTPLSWTLGTAPSARGLLGQVAKTGGEMAPIVAAGAIPGVGPAIAITGAAGQSATGAFDDNVAFVMALPIEQLEAAPAYQALIEAGKSPDDARAELADAAGRGSMLPAAVIGAGSGAILSGAATRPFQRMLTERFGNTFGARLGANLLEMPLEGLQEAGETILGRAGANAAAGTDRDLTSGTFGDFALGAAAAGPAAVVHSAIGGDVGASRPIGGLNLLQPAPAAPAVAPPVMVEPTPLPPGEGGAVSSAPPPLSPLLDADTIRAQAARQDPPVADASVPFMVTRPMRDALLAQGMTRGEIAKLTPAEATARLQGAAPAITPESARAEETAPAQAAASPAQPEAADLRTPPTDSAEAFSAYAQQQQRDFIARERAAMQSIVDGASQNLPASQRMAPEEAQERMAELDRMAVEIPQRYAPDSEDVQLGLEAARARAAAKAPDASATSWRSQLDAEPDLAATVREGLRARYEIAERVLPVFDADLREIANSVGGKAIVAPLKHAGRAAAKAAVDYDGDVGQIKDLVRGTIEVGGYEDATLVVEQLRAKYGEPLKNKSSLDPNKPAPFANGYRDLNSVWSINGEPVELQVNVPEMLAAKKKAHPIYAKWQAIERRATSEDRDLTAEEKAEQARLDAAQAAVYQPAWEAAMRRVNSAREMTEASSRNRDPESRVPSGQDRQTYPSSVASVPSGITPNTALSENSGSATAASGNVAVASMAGSLPQGSVAAAADADGAWASFPPESGTLGIPRAEMPQIKGQDRDAFFQYLAKKGFGTSKVEVSADTLKPTQAEYSIDKADRFAKTGLVGERNVIVSSDGYVLDGHHQWMGSKAIGVPVPTIRVDAPIRELLAAANEFPSVQRSEGPSAAPAAARPFADARVVADGIELPGNPNDVRAALRDIGIKGVIVARQGTIILQGKPLRNFQSWQKTQEATNEPEAAAGAVGQARGNERVDIGEDGSRADPAAVGAADAAAGRGSEADVPQGAPDPLTGGVSRRATDGQGGSAAATVVRQAADDFLAEYRGNIPLSIDVVDTLPNGDKARFDPATGAVTLSAAGIRDAKDARTSMRHEVLGHYGLDTLPAADKTAILDRVAAARIGAGSSYGMRKLWADVDARYADRPMRERAEEVFALAAESEPGPLGKAWDSVVSLVMAALRAAKLVRGAISVPELRETIRRIGVGLRRGAQAQTDGDGARAQRQPQAPAGDGGGGFSSPPAPPAVATPAPSQPTPPAAPTVDLRAFDFTPPGAKLGLIAKASQDVREQVAALKKLFNGQPKNPESIWRRMNDTRAAIFDSIMSRARALERRNAKSPSLRKLFNLAMAAPGDSRLVLETVNDAVAARFANFTNRARNILALNGLEKMTEAENASLRETMLGTAVKPLPKVRKAAAELRRLMNVQREDLIAAGVEVGEVTDVGYLTRMYDEARILTDEAGFTKAARELYEQHEFAGEVGATARNILYDDKGRLAQFLMLAKRATAPQVKTNLTALRAAIRTYRNGGALTEAKEVERIVDSMYAGVAKAYAENRAAAWLHAIKTPDVAQFVNGIGPSAAPVTKERQLSGAADAVMAKYLKTDMLDILDTYGRKVAGKVEHAVRFGPKGERLQELVDAASREGVPAGDLEQAAALVDSALGLKPQRIDPRIKGVADFVHTWVYLALLAKASFSSVMEAVTFTIRTGQLRHTAAPLVQVARALTKGKVAGYSSAELRTMAQAIGVNGHLAVEEVLMNRLGGDYAMTPQWSRLLQRFFKANLLTPLTRAQRAYGVGAATGYLRMLAQRLQAGKAAADTAALFNEVGIADHDAFAGWLLSQSGALPDPAGLFDADGRATPRGQDYMAAVRRIIDQSIQNPSAAHRPAWTNNPAGRLVTGIMSFSYASYENVIKGSLRRAARDDGAVAYGQRLAPVLAGAGALVIAQTIASTVRELLFNASRFDDKDDDEIAEEMAMLGLSRTFGLGSGDPLIQYLSGLKYQRTLAETALGAGPGMLAQVADAIGNTMSDRNSGNNETAEFRAAQKAYGVTVAPLLNMLLSRIPLVGGLAMIELSDKEYRDDFAGMFFTPPEPRSHLDDKYREAVAGVDKVIEGVEGRIALLPKDQWADELEKIRGEYPQILAGVTLDSYAPSKQNLRAGREGPKQTEDGKPRLKLAQGDFGSVLGELEGYPYYDVYRKRVVNSTGIEDDIRALNRAIKNVATAKTQDELLSFAYDFAEFAPSVKALTATSDPVDQDTINQVREELLARRRDLKHEAIEVIDKGKRGEPIERRDPAG